MLRYRLLSAAIVISSALCFVALDAWAENWDCTGLWMVPLGGYLIYGSAIECVLMSRSKLGAPLAVPALIGCAGVMLAACIPLLWPLSGSAYPQDCLLGPLGWPLAAGALAIVGSFVWMIPSYQAESGFFSRAILAGWVSVYFGSCFAFALALRLNGSPGWGLYLLVGMIVVTKFADAGAYFSGRAFGKHKLCPRVSPGKTMEGLVGGMATACLAAAIYFKLCAPWAFGPNEVSIQWLGVIALGVLLTLAGVAGDLLESIFKREMGCKDSGQLLPGLGGLWDVTDSLLPAAVVGYLVVLTGWISGPA
ncbi:MAG: phosphatidate cytidylyltransferase [Pirellulaceae bacterium]